MKPVLKSYHATTLQFHGTLSLTSELVSEIQKTSPPDDEGDSTFFDSYDGHRAWVWVIGIDKRVKEGVRRFRLEFNYEARKARGLGKLPRIQQLMQILSFVAERISFDCDVGFQFQKRLKPRAIISLPMRYSESPNMPFDRVQGLHLVKLDGSDTRYEVVLEAPTSGIVLEHVYFTYKGIIDESLAGRILTEAATISDKFVSLEQQHGKET